MSAKTCRLCLKYGKLCSVFDLRGSDTIATKVMSIAKVQIYPDDGLPSLICTKCIIDLDTCMNFITVCENSDLKLRTSMQTQLEKNILNSNQPLKYTSNSIERENYCKTDLQETLIATNDCLTLNEGVLLENGLNRNIQSDLSENYEEELNIAIKKSQKQQCFTCGKVMSSSFRLKTHLRTHTGERPFQCPHCNKNFSLAQNLKVHLRIHTGEKPLSCSVCGESFAQSAGLAVHKRKHTGQTPYQCMLCPRSFRTVGHLQYHIRRHTGEKNFECDTCGRTFITRSDLKQHLISHTGDKPHVCCICGMRLTRASHLRRHIRITHNEEKIFACVECPSKFSQKRDLEKHRKKHASKLIKEL